MADQAMIDDDAPELDDAFFARARPMTEVLTPAQQRSFKPRGPQKAPTKQLVSLRLDPDVIGYFKASGSGWQSRINETLRRVVEPRPEGGAVRSREAPSPTMAPEVKAKRPVSDKRLAASTLGPSRADRATASTGPNVQIGPSPVVPGSRLKKR